MISYLFESSFYLLFFYGFYLLALKNSTFFGVNRFYLIVSPLIASLLPLAKRSGVTAGETVQIQLPEIVLGGAESIQNTAQKLYSSQISTYLYLSILSLLGLFFIYKIIRILISIYRNPKSKNSDYTLVYINSSNRVYSWFRYIFADESHLSPKILKHEMVHIKKLHTFDLMAIELFGLLHWFNPVILLIRNELKLIHEFEADEIAAEGDSVEYSQLLLSKAFDVSQISIVHNFIQFNQLKTRIKMLHKIKSSKLRLLRFLFLIPLTALMSLPYACSNESQNSNSKDLETVQEPDANSENQVFDMQTVDVKPSLKDTDASLSDKEKEDLFMKAIFSHITSNFKYPEQAKKDGVQGKVIVNFTIGADGKVADAKVLRGVEASLDQEALKIVESLPEFNPAKVGDKNVPVSFALPITFRLQ